MVGQTQPHPEWRAIVERLRSLAYGEVIPHAAIAAQTGLAVESRAYYQHANRAVRALLYEYGIEVENVPGVGYKRTEPHRYAERARRQWRLGDRRIRRGSVIVVATPVALLKTPEQVREHEHTMEHASKRLAAQKTLRQDFRKALASITTDRPRLTGGGADEAAVAR